MSSLFREFSHYLQSLDSPDSREIVFIDSRVANCENLIQQAAPAVRVIVFGLGAEAIDEITQIF